MIERFGQGRSVAFSGYYGALNSGDDAFCEVSAWGALRYWRAAKPLFFADNLPRLKTGAQCYSPHKSYVNFSRAVIDIARRDLFVSAGGSTFHSALKATDLRTYVLAKKRLRLPGQACAIGISLGPYTNVEAERSTIRYLKTLDFLALRDTRSYEIAQSYDLPVSPILAFDLAALLPEVYGEIYREPSPERRVIGVCLCKYESYVGGDSSREASRIQFFKELLGQVGRESNVLLRFIEFNGHSSSGDLEVTSEVVASLPDGVEWELVRYAPDVEYMFRQIESCEFVISIRLHASIFACFAGVGFMLCEYHRKCTDFLDDIGQHLSLRIGDAEVDVESALLAIRNALFARTPKPASLASAVELARKNFTSLPGL